MTYTAKVGLRKPQPLPEMPDWLKGDGIAAAFYKPMWLSAQRRNETVRKP